MSLPRTLVNGDAGLLALGGLLADLGPVVSLKPGAEGRAINCNDAVLHQGLGADQLVVAGVVNYVQNTGLLGDGCKGEL